MAKLVGVFLAAVVFVSGCSDSNETSYTALSLADTPGPFAVGAKTDVLLRDDSRDREVTTTYWYPISGENAGPEQASEGAPLIPGEQQFPLVVLVHGTLGNGPATWPYLAPHLASHGYIVITPSTGSNLTNVADLPNHPGDISFLIDAALGVNSSETTFLGRANENKIAVGGFSLGAAATYLTVYQPPYLDSRIKAAIIMAGLGLGGPPINPHISLLALYGTDDPAIAYSDGRNLYEAANALKYFLTLQGGGHVGFTSQDDNNYGPTMGQGRQEALTRLSVFAFLASIFSDSEPDRNAARQYLQVKFNEDNLDAELIYELE
jgi:dienelactone hydrolase